MLVLGSSGASKGANEPHVPQQEAWTRNSDSNSTTYSFNLRFVQCCNENSSQDTLSKTNYEPMFSICSFPFMMENHNVHKLVHSYFRGAQARWPQHNQAVEPVIQHHMMWRTRKERKRVTVTVRDRASSGWYRYKRVLADVSVWWNSKYDSHSKKNIKNWQHAAEVMMSLHSLLYQPERNTLKPYGLWSLNSNLMHQPPHVHGVSDCLNPSGCQSSFRGTDMQSKICMFMPGKQRKFSA